MSDVEEIPLKRCPKCRETKPLNAFSRDKSKKDGRCSHCKACQSEYHIANAEHNRARNRAYNAANADSLREYKRAWHAANPEKYREYKRAYRTAHPRKNREYKRAWNAANADHIREHNRVRRAIYPEIHRAQFHRRRARLKANGGNVTAHELRLLRATQGGYCAYCQHFHGPRLTIEHIIPIDQGGMHEAGNICLACPRCNYNKQDRTPDQWVNRWYYDWKQRDTEYIPAYWYD